MIAEAYPPPIAIFADATVEPAQQDLPTGAVEIIDAALGSADAAEAEVVIRAARRAYPNAIATINAHVTAWRVRNLPSVPLPSTSADAVTSANAKDATSSARNDLSAPEDAFDYTRVLVEVEGGAFANTGNAPGIGLVGGVKLLAEGANWRIASHARADYQKTGNLVTREQYRFSAEPNFKFDRRGYTYGLGEFEQDRFQGVASRYSLSGGLGYSVLKNDGAKVSVKAGPAWRVTHAVDGERDSVVAGLTSMEAKIKLTPSLEFSQNANAYFDARGSTFYTLAALDSRLIGKLKMRLSYVVQHETAPELGRRGTDTTSRLTLVYGR